MAIKTDNKIKYCKNNNNNYNYNNRVSLFLNECNDV